MQARFIILCFFAISFCYSQSNSALSVEQATAIEKEGSRLYTKVLEFKKQGLFTEVYDRQSHWSCTPDKDETYINSRLNELYEIEKKWKRPNGDIARYNSYVKDLTDYAEKNCSNHNIGCRYRNVNAPAVENSLAYLNRYIDKFKQCLANLSSETENVANSSYSGANTTNRSNQSSNSGNTNYPDYQPRSETQMQEELTNSIDNASRNITSLFNKRADKFIGARMHNKTSENKKSLIIFEKYLEELYATLEERANYYKSIPYDSAKLEQVQEIAKHYEYGQCPSSLCKFGYMIDKKLCHVCDGKGYTIEKITTLSGLTRNTDTKHVKCYGCNGIGIEDVRNETKKCYRCHGNYKKAFIYNGNSYVSKNSANEIAIFFPNYISFIIDLKEFFRENPSKEYYYELYDDGQQFTNIKFWNRKLDEYQPDNVQEEIDKIFDERKRAREAYQKKKKDHEEFIRIKRQMPVKGSEDWHISKSKGKNIYITDLDDREILKTKIEIDSAYAIPKLNKIITYHTKKNGVIYSSLYNSSAGNKLLGATGYIIDYEVSRDSNTYIFYYYDPKTPDSHKTLLDYLGFELKHFPQIRKKEETIIKKWEHIENTEYIITELNSGLKGMINTLYYKKIPPKFDDFGEIKAIDFDNNLIPAKSKGKWGFINKYGKTVIRFKYDVPNNQKKMKGFKDGKIRVMYKGELVTIDTKGKIIE